MEMKDIVQKRNMLIKTIICILSGTTYNECNIILHEVESFLKNKFESEQYDLKFDVSEKTLSYLSDKYK